MPTVVQRHISTQFLLCVPCDQVANPQKTTGLHRNTTLHVLTC